MQQGFSKLTKGLHWLSLFLIIAAYASMEFKGVFERGSAPRELMKASHYLFGLAILLLTVPRVLNRWWQPYPAILPTPPVWQHKLAALTHLLLYGFLLLMPLLGWLLLSAEGKHIVAFGFEFPALIAADKERAEWFEFWHETLATAGYFLIGLHIVAALYHQHIVGDNTLARMSWRAPKQ